MDLQVSWLAGELHGSWDWGWARGSWYITDVLWGILEMPSFITGHRPLFDPATLETHK
jgi:hypothetical protein